jgi:hypothetical protein
MDTLIESNAIKYKPIKEGSYSVIITDKACKTKDTLACYLFSTQSIDQNKIDNYKISPNPFTEEITISNIKENIENYTIEIKSLDGKIVMKKELINDKIDTSKLNTGIYIISIINYTNEIEFSTKIVKL